MTNTFDSIMGWAIPALLIIVAIGFVYVKFIKPWFIPLIKDAWDWINGNTSADNHHAEKQVTYD